MNQTKSSPRFGAKWQQRLLQAIFIFICVLLSLTVVTWVLQKVLVKEALELEAHYFINERQRNPDFPLPKTRNLVGYLVCEQCSQALPSELQPLSSGLHLSVTMRHSEDAVSVFVKDADIGRLYLVFKGQNVDRLVGLFGIIPLGILLIIVYLASWIAYQFSSRAISPMLRIARRLQSTDADEAPLKISMNRYSGEARELAQAVDDYTKRMDEMVTRERQFSADVSHELRTPITIIDGAAQFIESEQGLSDKGQHRTRMIRRASKDISELIDAFLILGRDPELENVTEAVDVSDVASSEISKLKPLLTQKGTDLRVQTKASLNVFVNRKVFEIIIGNLCRNAIKHTDEGTISVIIDSNQVFVNDTGSGIDESMLPFVFDRHVKGRGTKQAGEGIGLNIVKRLCDLYKWDIGIVNKPEGGVSVSLTIPNDNAYLQPG